MGATSGTGSATSLERLSSRTVYNGVRVARSICFCVVFCRSLFVLFHLVIVLSVLRYYYLFGIVQLLI